MNLPPEFRTARALSPQMREALEEIFLYEPLPPPEDHPELALFKVGDASRFTLFHEVPVKHPVIVPDEAPTEADKLFQPALTPSRLDEPIPARMLNEFVYCPRLFYYEFVDGVFVENADTERGKALHARVDKGKGDLPAAKKPKGKKRDAADEPDLLSQEGSDLGTPACSNADDAGKVPVLLMNDDTADADIADEAGKMSTPPVEETIHSRSATLSSERLGVVAKMDLVEVRMGISDLGTSQRVAEMVTPVDYKAGAPRPGADANELWDTDKIQLGLQMLILRDNGYTCQEGVIYYRATKQRVRLPMTVELETWIIERIAAARHVAAQRRIPPPLVNSPKCVRCSLAPVCLPDETRMLSLRSADGDGVTAKPKIVNREPGTIRRLMAARDDERALYLNTPGVRVGLKSELLVVKDGDRVLDEVRLSDVTHVALFGNIQLTTQAIHELCEQEIPVAYFSMGGWFYGITRGHGLKNVFTRIEQFRMAGDAARCLALARKIVQGKIRNHRTMLMRLHVEAPPAAVEQLKELAARVSDARSLDELLGMEGAAAAVYFQHFSGMIKVQADDDELPGLEQPEKKSTENGFNFDFTKRTRRPPTDPVNALLSLAYSLLSKDCTIAALAVGFDPYVGFYHQPRFGRPALALDLMEELRPLIAESTVLTAINNRMITTSHFVRAGDAVNLTTVGRKIFFQAYEQRMNSLITHPIFDYKVSYRRVLELQARLLASHLTGEISDYVPMVTR